MSLMTMRVFFIAILVATAPAFAQQTYTRPGTLAPNVTEIQGCSGDPRGCIAVPVSGSLSVSGTADTAGNTATFNANNVCTSVVTAGEQSAGFHLTAGTLDATLTPYYTNQTGVVNCATAGTCTVAAFSSGSTIVVTNPSGVKDVGINVVGGVRQVQVCTTTFGSGSASGVVTATYLQAASSGGGGGGSVTQGTSPWVTADNHTAAAAPLSLRLSDGAAFYNTNTAAQLPAALDGSGFLKTHEQGTATVSGTVAVSNSFALDATLTGGTQQAQVKSGAKGASAAALVTSTANGADHQGLDVQVQNATLAATQSGTWTVQPGNTANTTAWKVDGSAVTQPVSGTVTTTPPANASTNVAQLAGTTTDTNSGAKSAGTLRVVIATDQPQLTNKLLVTPDSVALPANQSVNVSQVGGSAVTTLAAGEQKVGVEGVGASGAAKAGNPVQVGGIFNTTQPTVTTGQPLLVPGADSGGWVPTRPFPSARPGEVRFVLWDVDGSNAASIIPEGAEEVIGGVATHSELIEKNAEIQAAPGEQRTYIIRSCSWPYVRLSASGPAPSYPSTNVQGGIEIIP